MNRRNTPSESQFTRFIVHRYSDPASDYRFRYWGRHGKYRFSITRNSPSNTRSVLTGVP